MYRGRGLVETASSLMDIFWATAHQCIQEIRNGRKGDVLYIIYINVYIYIANLVIYFACKYISKVDTFHTVFEKWRNEWEQLRII